MIARSFSARLLGAALITSAMSLAVPQAAHALDVGISIGGGGSSGGSGSSGGGVSASVSVGGSDRSGRSDRGRDRDNDRGSRGVSANVDVGVGGGRGLDADADVRVGGRNGVRAGVDVGVGGGDGVGADVDIGIGGGGSSGGSGGSGGSVSPGALQAAVSNMSEGQLAAHRSQCQVVLRRPQRYDRDLVALCQLIRDLQPARQ